MKREAERPHLDLRDLLQFPQTSISRYMISWTDQHNLQVQLRNATLSLENETSMKNLFRWKHTGIIKRRLRRHLQYGQHTTLVKSG